MIHRHGPSTRTDPLPTSIKPMLAVPGELPSDDEHWAFEIKWDGVRTILFVEGGRVRAQNRNDLDVTTAFPEVADIGKFLGMTTCVIDGEVVALGEDGRPSFSRLQHRMHVTNQREAHRRATTDPVSFVAFDLLYIDGHLLLEHSYDERRVRLEALHLAGDTFTTTDSFATSGRDILDAATANGSRGGGEAPRCCCNRPGRRHPDWIKVKAFRTQEVVIGGWTEGRGERDGGLGALLLGVPGPDGLRYIGKVGTGFSDRARLDLLNDLRPLTLDVSPFDSPLPARETSNAHFVRPDLVGEVAYGEWTPAGRLRHPIWRGRRPDKKPDQVVVE